MSPLYSTLTALAEGLRDRFRALRAEPERGALSIEQVVITVALLGIALALMVIIANAVTSRSAQIQ